VTNRRFLLSLAHPDDETFGSGGLVARYVAEGAAVYLICATNGDVGTVPPEMLNGYPSVAELRLAELDCASAILGFKKVFKLGYKDSGMMNSETCNDPTCLWQAPREQVARRVVEVIREVKPQVVLTFDPYGGYGHPDHITIQRATTDAFQLAGDASYVTGEQAPYAPQKLYYTAFPKTLFRIYIGLARLKGQDTRRLGRNRDLDLQAVLDNIKPVHTQINVRDYIEIWDRANTCHASQIGGGFPRLPLMVRKRIGHKQGFTRVYPAPAHNSVDEDDLFAGVAADGTG